jgi:hypothetical protein
MEGVPCTLVREAERDVFRHGNLEAFIALPGRVMTVQPVAGCTDGRLPLSCYHILRVLRDGVLARVNPVTAEFLAAVEVEV